MGFTMEHQVLIKSCSGIHHGNQNVQWDTILYILSFRNAKTVDLYVNRRISENRAFIGKSEYYNNYYGNRKHSLDHDNQKQLFDINLCKRLKCIHYEYAGFFYQWLTL